MIILPKWIQIICMERELDNAISIQDWKKIVEALTIAWEVLEIYGEQTTLNSRSNVAMRRIEELSQ